MSETTKDHVQSVVGLVNPEDLGYTLTHEHLKIDYSSCVQDCGEHGISNELFKGEISLNNFNLVNRYPYCHEDNLNVANDGESVLSDVKLFKERGGGCIVDNTTIGIGRDARFLRELSTQTGVHVIAPTGLYLSHTVPASYRGYTVEQLYDLMVKEITQGIDGTDIKAGVIGEIGCEYPLEALERRCLLAASQTQQQLGAPLIIHPGRYDDSPVEIMRLVLESGGLKDKVVMSHMERTYVNPDSVFDLLELGCIVEYDFFGIETSFYPKRNELDMMNDGERVRIIKKIIDQGFLHKVAIAHDIHTKHRLTKYGGHGYSHILEHIVPLMLRRGISQSQVDVVLKTTPQRWLTFTK